MNFELALTRLKRGRKIRNQQWDPGMYIVLQAGYPDGIPINKNTAKATGIPEGTVVKFRPYIMLHTIDGSFVPYVATQIDLLSEVWETVD